MEIVIYFYNPDGSQVPPGKLSIAAANQGKVVYYIDDPQKHTLKLLHEESYEEALKLVKKDGSNGNLGGEN